MGEKSNILTMYFESSLLVRLWMDHKNSITVASALKAEVRLKRETRGLTRIVAW